MKKLPKDLKEKRVLVAVTLLEADLLRLLRTREYGEGRFKIAEGQPYMLYFEESQVVRAETGMELDGAVPIEPGLEEGNMVAKFNSRTDGDK